MSVFPQEFAYDRTLYSKTPDHKYLFIKRVGDIAFSLFLIIVLSPLMLLTALTVFLIDGVPPLYFQERIGIYGRRFMIAKFRTMKKDADELSSVLDDDQLDRYQKEFKLEHDPRVTKTGGFLRRSSLDELPQLFQVLSGKLSLIGPRPIVEEELRSNYTEEEIACLLSVMPGISGYWQVYVRNDAEYSDHKRQDMELYYVKNCSLKLDLKIFFRTFASVLSGKGVH